MEVSLNQDVLVRLNDVWSEVGLSDSERVKRTEWLRQQIIRVYVDALSSATEERDALESELEAAELLSRELEAELKEARSSAGAAASFLCSQEHSIANSSSNSGGGYHDNRSTALPHSATTRPGETARGSSESRVGAATTSASALPGLLQRLDEVSRHVSALEAEKRRFLERVCEAQKRILALWVDELGEVVDDLPEAYRDTLILTRGLERAPAAAVAVARPPTSRNLSNDSVNKTQVTTVLAAESGIQLRRVSLRNYGQRLAALDAKITELLELRRQRVETIASLLLSVRNLLRRLCIASPEQAESEIDRIAVSYDGDSEPLGASLVSIEVLTARVSCLEREIEARVEELDRVSGEAAELYRLLRYPPERFSTFQAEHGTLSQACLEAWHAHVDSLRATREQRLRTLIAGEQHKLKALWEELGTPLAERASFHAADVAGDVSDALLEAYESEVARLEGVAQRVRPILELMARRRDLYEKRTELEREMKNPERLFGRSGGRRHVGGLLREEQLRRQLRALPKVRAALVAQLEAYEREFQRPFMVQGVRMLEEVRAEQEREAEAAQQRPLLERQRRQRLPGFGERLEGMVPLKSSSSSAAAAAPAATGNKGGKAPTTATSPATWGGGNGASGSKRLAAEVRKHLGSRPTAAHMASPAGSASSSASSSSAVGSVAGGRGWMAATVSALPMPMASLATFTASSSASSSANSGPGGMLTTNRPPGPTEPAPQPAADDADAAAAAPAPARSEPSAAAAAAAATASSACSSLSAATDASSASAARSVAGAIPSSAADQENIGAAAANLLPSPDANVSNAKSASDSSRATATDTADEARRATKRRRSLQAATATAAAHTPPRAPDEPDALPSTVQPSQQSFSFAESPILHR
ncbi:hypothetical protein CDCA_CDCA05G1638 [Cyanidium caldarium]|uniref:Microtubule associated protein n=1 Tax=Cyanidium caldarium TaxID=2771 RepID=A0AAV9IU60_CYACA|nr:hypothetical protein CDCA_CDCA05G1638 [Cyanidium caldarium]